MTTHIDLCAVGGYEMNIYTMTTNEQLAWIVGARQKSPNTGFSLSCPHGHNVMSTPKE